MTTRRLCLFKDRNHTFRSSDPTDLEQFLNLGPPKFLFFDHVTGTDGLQPIAELGELWPLKRRQRGVHCCHKLRQDDNCHFSYRASHTCLFSACFTTCLHILPVHFPAVQHETISMFYLDLPVSDNIDGFYSSCSSDLYDSLPNAAVGCILDHRVA